MADDSGLALATLDRCIRYSSKRALFFRNLHNYTTFIGGVAGSSAFVTLISGKPELAVWLTGLIAVVLILDNVVRFSERAQEHESQRQKYYALQDEILASSQQNYSERDFKIRKAKIDRLSGARRKVLDVLCRNESELYRGRAQSEVMYISKPRRWLAHVIDLSPKEWLSVAEYHEKK